MAVPRQGEPDPPPGAAKDLVDLFRRLLLHRPRTLVQISAETYVSRSYLSEIIRGRKTPSPEVANKIGAYLGTPTDANYAQRLAERHREEIATRGRDATGQRPSAAALRRAAGGHLVTPPRRAIEADGEYIVGRQQEVDNFDRLLDGRAGFRVLNVFGPGGIGKTAVVRKLRRHARNRGALVGMVDLSDPDMSSVDGILAGVTQTLLDGADQRMTESLVDFSTHVEDFRLLTGTLAAMGGVERLFDPLGQVRDPAALARTWDGRAWPTRLSSVLRNRFSLDRYLRQAEQSLTNAFGAALEAGFGRSPIALILDTYEDIGTLDNWTCRSLAPTLPAEIRLVIVGRNQVTGANVDWADHGDHLHMRSLPELSEDEARQYLRHFGATDEAVLDKIIRFTGGYPLLLVLVRLLAKERGGWSVIGELDHSSDRDVVATGLLDRILREEQAREVRDVLEKTAIASWVNPEVIAAILDLSADDARRAYERVRRHSFMEPHPYGVKLHDKIRELLIERLRFTSESGFDQLEAKLIAYHAAQAERFRHA